MASKRGALASVFTVAVLLLGCSGGDDKANESPSSPSATTASDKSDSASDQSDTSDSTPSADGGGGECALVGTDAVTKAMGQEMEVVLSYADGCEWRATADSAIQVFVTKIPVDEYSVSNADPLSGVGDEAFVRKGLATTTLYLRVGSDHFSVEAGDLNSADQYQDEMIAIATSLAAAVG